MKYLQIAIVCLLTVSAFANIDDDLAIESDFVKSKLELFGSFGGGRIGGGIGGGRIGGGISMPRPTTPISRPTTPISRPITPIIKPVTPITKPVTPITKPVTPITKPVTPITKPVTPITKPVTPITKPVTPITKPVTPITKPVTPITKPVTPITKPVTPITKPVTPITKPVTPITKPVTPGTPITKPSTPSGSIASNTAYINKLWSMENAAKVGFDKKTGMWVGNAAPEKGGKVDYGPGLKLPYKQGGYTQAEIDKALTNKLSSIESTLRTNVQKLGKNYDSLSEAQKKLLVDYSYNTGNAFKVFPKFSKAVVDGDVNGMNAEYKRTWVDKSGKKQELTARNDWAKSIIDSIGKN